MLKIADANVMRRIDNFCIEELKIPGIVLMENAALKLIKHLELEKNNSFSIVCAKGNNGGDGFAVARHLALAGKKINLFLIGTTVGMSNDCAINFEIIKKLKIEVINVNNIHGLNLLKEALKSTEICIDAIFGTGLSRDASGIYSDAISAINENSDFIVAIDIPSGLNSDTGEVLGNCIKANKTVSFQLYKKGFLRYGSNKYTGDIIVEDIGIPEFVVNKFYENQGIIDKVLVKNSIINRDKYGHKGTYGKVLIFAGSKGFTGAAYIAVQGAVKSGAGLVTLCCSEKIQDILSSKLVEAMTIARECDEKVNDAIVKSTAIAIGPGMGNSEDTLTLTKNVLNKANCPLVIDADGINGLNKDLEQLQKFKHGVILTPHVGELSRITGLSIEYINQNRIDVARNFAKKNKVVLLLKGYNTIITDGEVTWVNSTGNSAMASGGMGDCLTGVITSFLAQGYGLMTAAIIGAFIHGYCGEKLSKTMYSVSASDILEQIPFVIKELT